MKIMLLSMMILIFCLPLLATDELYLSGVNEAAYIYRTAQDSLNSYFRDAFSFSMGYRDFTFGMKFLAQLPKYSTEQTQLLGELDANKLSYAWTERFLEYAKDDLLIHAGTISESFGSGMVFRSWEDIEFDQDNRVEGFLAKYNGTQKLKALYAAIPNKDQPAKYDLVYGADWEAPFAGLGIGAAIVTLRTITALNKYNQQDIYSGRMNWNYDLIDGGMEYAATAMMKNGAANRSGSGINAYSNIYLKPGFVKSLSLGAAYKKYDQFQYRLQDLKTMNYHNETLADNLTTGSDEEGLQGILTVSPTDGWVYTANYAEAWNDAKTKKMNDVYTSLEWQNDVYIITAEYGHTEKLDDETSHWQKDLKPALNFSMPIGNLSLTTKAEYQYIEKTSHDVTNFHYEPLLQIDLGMGKLSVSGQAESFWITADDVLDGRYWANVEAKYGLWEHTDITLFAGKQAGGKVCRNGICRYVAPFQGVKMELVTRF